jgi:hypothetical protein
MAPHDELAAVEGNGADKAAGKAGVQVFTLAQPGEVYVSYLLGKGPVTVVLKLAAGSFDARWYDPQRGRFLGPVQPSPGGGPCRLRSPAFAQDVALYVRRTGKASTGKGDG